MANSPAKNSKGKGKEQAKKSAHSLNYTKKRRKTEVGAGKDRSKGRPTKTELETAIKVLTWMLRSLATPAVDVPMEEIPIGAEGTAYLVGRDKDQELVIHPIPAADKLCRSEATGDAIYFSNT